MSEIVIEIKTRPKFRPFVAAYSILVSTSPIIVGIIADSAAMQWAGLILFVLISIALAAARNQGLIGLTIEQARAKLDQIESREAKP